MKYISLKFSLIGLLLIVAMVGMTAVTNLTAVAAPLQQSTLPTITFLGEGPGTFSVDPPLKLLVKTYENGQFLFVEHDAGSYTAESGERVWATNFVPAEPIRLFHEERNYGQVSAGCVVNFVQIEDNPDNRRNTFYINGEVLHVVEQGWVTYGSVTVPEDGVLTFYAEDSIGMVIEICPGQVTVAPPTGVPPTDVPPTDVPPTDVPPTDVPPTGVPPTDVPPTDVPPTALPPTDVPATATQAVPTATNTLPPSAIVVVPTNTQVANPTVTSSVPTVSGPTVAAPTVAVTPAATNTTVPTVIAQPVNPTATRQVAVVQITATRGATAAAIPVTGGTAAPQEMAAIGLAIFGLFGLLAAAWWFVLRAYRHGR